MLRVTVRFYEELNDFIRPESRKKPVERLLVRRITVQDLIESFDVPSDRVDLVLVNGVSADFGHLVNDGDRISVYPVFESFDISAVTRLQERPLRNLRFIADRDLGELTGRMRLLGLDVEYCEWISDEELAVASVNDGRVLLSRNQRLLNRKNIDRGFLLQSQDPLEQLEEVIRRFDLRHYK